MQLEPASFSLSEGRDALDAFDNMWKALNSISLLPLDVYDAVRDLLYEQERSIRSKVATLEEEAFQQAMSRRRAPSNLVS